MTDWVQNIMHFHATNFDSNSTESVQLKMNLGNVAWMDALGFRSDTALGGYFEAIPQPDGSLLVYADTSCEPPIESAFEKWADEGVIFDAYYMSLDHPVFFGRWSNNEMREHERYEVCIETAKKDPQKIIRKIKSRMANRFDVKSRILEAINESNE